MASRWECVAVPAEADLGGGGGSSMSNGALNPSRGGTATFGGGSGGNNNPVANTPLPNAPKRKTGMVPSRASFQLPDIDDMLNTDFGPGPGAAPEPIGLIPTGTPNSFKDNQFVPADRESKQIGTFGMILTSLLIGSLAFLAFKLLTGNGFFFSAP